MSSKPSLPVLLSFGPFELNTQSGELQKNAIRIRLSGQPVRILLVLLERCGQVVSREELRQQIWTDGTFVDFEGGLNAAINKLRRALSDSAENPRYVETIPSRGYRFIGALDPVVSLASAAPDAQRAAGIDRPTARPTLSRQRLLWWLAAAACLIGGFVLVQRLRSHRSSLVQWQFTQLTQDGEFSDSPASSRDGQLLGYSLQKDGTRDLYVKHLSGGQPIRLTFDGAGNTMPDFSPDGSKIVFRSNRDGGGIYEIAAFGGETRLLARGGLDPKYSPDGTKVAFWIGDDSVVPTIPGNGAVWVVPSKGGAPFRVGARLTTARRPIWSPDGRRLLLIGYASRRLWEASSLDWWTISENTDVVAKTGIRDALLKAGLEHPGYDNYSNGPGNTLILPAPACWLAEGGRIIFSALTGDARNLWSTQISADGKIAGATQRLTEGSGNETNASCAANNTVVFAKKTFAGDLWSFPFDLGAGKPTGPPVQLTHGPSIIREGPSVSADGQRVAFSRLESSEMSVWIHDVTSGKETKLAASSFAQRFPVIAPSGDRVAYSSYENDRRFLYVGAPGGVPERVCDGCVRPTDWSRDGRKLLTFKGSPYQVSLLDVATHEQTTLLAHPTYSLLLAHFSPDNRWVSFTARVQPNRAWIMIAPIDLSQKAGPLPVPEASWIKVSEEDGVLDEGIWSPDGKMLYFTSSRDGHVCLWARRLDLETRQPAGEPFVAQHFHEWPMGGVRLWSTAAGRVVVSLTNDTSSIWMMSRQLAR
jgi:Tol biopolymer transport system component/DNA-binding winged helix-turn-helix (wHTH) protein